MDDLYNNSWVPGGWASLRSVATQEKEDHMHSFFLAETCKYLYLLYNDSFLRVRLLQWTQQSEHSANLFPLNVLSPCLYNIG